VLRFVFASVGCALTWAVSTVIFARVLRGAPGGSPAALNLVKCVLAFPPLVALGLAQGDGWPTTAGHGGALFVSAALGLAVSDTGYFVALSRLGVARGVLFIPLVPVVTAALAAVFLGDPLGATEGAGMALVLGGLVLVLVRGQTDDVAGTDAHDVAPAAVKGAARARLVGVLAGLGSALAQGVSNTLMKKAVVAGAASHVAALRIGFGSVALAVVVALSGGPHTVLPFLRRGVFGPVFVASCLGTFLGMWLGTYGAKGLPIGIATTLAATTPVWALVLARFTGERVTLRAAAGAVVAVAGVVVLALSTLR